MSTNKHLRQLLLIAAIACLSFCLYEAKAQDSRPNIILIVADDLGYNDLSSYGNKELHTPNIDGLAQQGVRFTQAYVSSPICAPSREAIFTGRYQQRFGDEFMPYDHIDRGTMNNLFWNYRSLRKTMPGLKYLKPDIFVNRSGFNNGLPETEITIAQLLKSNGYATGLVGKWNLGVGEGFYPDQRGFDYSYYFEGALTRYVDESVDTTGYVNVRLPWAFSEAASWAPRWGSTAIKEGRSVVKDTAYLTFSFADKAIHFIEKNKQSPFFLTITFNAPHDPFQVPAPYFNRLAHVSDTVKRVYYGMIEAMDDAVGRILQQLKASGINKNTMIIFLSDNGGATYTKATTNTPLRGGKCTHFDGGLIVPMFIKYPPAFHDSTIYESPVSSLDVFSTIAAVTQSSLPQHKVYDGVNLLPYTLHQTSESPHKVFYFRNGYSKAIRSGPWKLYLNLKSKKTFLFNLDNDKEEQHDLSNQYPARVQELKTKLQQWEDSQWIKPRWRSGSDVLIDVNGELFYFPT